MTTEPLEVTDAELAAWERVTEAASPREEFAKGRTELKVITWNKKGDWALLYDDCDLCAVVEDNPGMGCWASDYAVFFAMSRAVMPMLIAEVRRLRALSRRAEKGATP